MEDYFSRQELANRWGFHTNTISNYMKQGRIPYYRTAGGRIVRFPRKEILRLEAEGLTFERRLNL